MTYTPNRWVVLKVDNGTQIVNKVFAGWSGGYLDGDDWRLNSGNLLETEFADRWEFTGYSGSVYICYKHNYGMNSYMQSVWDSWQVHLQKLKPIASMQILESYAE